MAARLTRYPQTNRSLLDPPVQSMRDVCETVRAEQADASARIRGFADQLRPGVKVLPFNGAGQNGVWEDVAGRAGDVGSVAPAQA